MKHFLGSLFAIGVASVAAIAATSSWLNSSMNIGPATGASNPPGQSAPAPADKGAAPEAGTKPGSSKDIPEATPRGTPTPEASKPAPEGAATPDDDKDDKDPYEGIAPDELPPDLQYDADSSVSFPTNI